jgi:hypothetical protein
MSDVGYINGLVVVCVAVLLSGCAFLIGEGWPERKTLEEPVSVTVASQLVQIVALGVSRETFGDGCAVTAHWVGEREWSKSADWSEEDDIALRDAVLVRPELEGCGSIKMLLLTPIAGGTIASNVSSGFSKWVRTDDGEWAVEPRKMCFPGSMC